MLLCVISFLLFLRYPYRILRNLYYAKRTGLAYVVIPIDQDSLLWIVTSLPLQSFYKKSLPPWMFDRFRTMFWGWEYHEKNTPWQRFAANSSDPRTFAAVTAGSFEIDTWDPEFGLEVLRRPNDFVQPYITTVLLSRFGHNVLTTDGEKWARQRRVIAQVINERISKPIFEESLKQTTGLLDEVTDHGEKTSMETFSLFDMMRKITVHVLSGAGMGQPVGWETSSDKPKPGRHTTYMSSVNLLISAVTGPILLPGWVLDNYPAFMPGHSLIRSIAQAVREYPVHTREMLQKERQHQNQTGEVRADIVSQVLQATKSDKSGTSLTEDEIVGNLFIFTIAGFDTTANTLSFALAALAREPKWQDWMFEEIDAILPQDPSATLEYNALFPRIRRVLAVMFETLRIFTPLVHLGKQVTRDKDQIVQTSKGTYHLPAGTQVYISAIGLHLQPEVWRDINKTPDDVKDAPEDMPDELVFRPSRWIVTDGDSQTLFRPPPGSFIPWSAGPRSCPGMKMAQVEFVGTFLTLFRAHRIAAVPLQVPHPGETGLGARQETPSEVTARLDERLKDSLSLITLQMKGIYDVSKPGNEDKGIELRISRRK